MTRPRRMVYAPALALGALLLGCSSGGSGGATSSGGATAVGGVTGAGGETIAGGATGSGGATGKGGSTGSGGASMTAGFACAADVHAPVTGTYFVDFDSGADTSDGRTQVTAWKHAPGDAAASALAAAAVLKPGDVVLFKGGVVYQGSITIPVSGNASAPIIYAGDSSGTWGRGLAVVSGEGTRTQGFVVRDKSYVIIDGFDLRSFSKSSSSTAVSIDGGSNNGVRYCRISDVYYPTNPGGKTWERQSGTGIAVNNSPLTKVQHNFVRDVGNRNAYLVATSSMPGFFADYNLIYRVGGSGPVVGLNTGPAESPGGDAYDLPTLKSKTALEQHGIYGDPQWSAAFSTVDSDPSGFLPQATSPAIDHGTDLGYTSDFTGQPIPGSTAPDIGAFERQP
jgi:hypothetical protein